jgi:hypothetical protein
MEPPPVKSGERKTAPAPPQPYPRRLLAGQSLLRQESFPGEIDSNAFPWRGSRKGITMACDRWADQTATQYWTATPRSSDPRIGLRLLVGLQLTRVSCAYVSLSLSWTLSKQTDNACNLQIRPFSWNILERYVSFCAPAGARNNSAGHCVLATCRSFIKKTTLSYAVYSEPWRVTWGGELQIKTLPGEYGIRIKYRV